MNSRFYYSAIPPLGQYDFEKMIRTSNFGGIARLHLYDGILWTDSLGTFPNSFIASDDIQRAYETYLLEKHLLGE